MATDDTFLAFTRHSMPLSAPVPSQIFGTPGPVPPIENISPNRTGFFGLLDRGDVGFGAGLTGAGGFDASAVGAGLGGTSGDANDLTKQIIIGVVVAVIVAWLVD